MCHGEWAARKDVGDMEVAVTEAGRATLSDKSLINRLSTKYLLFCEEKKETKKKKP